MTKFFTTKFSLILFNSLFPKSIIKDDLSIKFHNYDKNHTKPDRRPFCYIHVKHFEPRICTLQQYIHKKLKIQHKYNSLQCQLLVHLAKFCTHFVRFAK
jgi:hypothetical protein